MAAVYEDELNDLETLSIHAADAEVVTWNGRRAVRVVDGLALVPHLEASDVTIEVSIGSEGPAYPGVAFRAADVANYELAYAVPHASGLWDAIQYDPIFHLSNTWQLYHGPAYQHEAIIPVGEWFRLTVDVAGDKASCAVGDQEPLYVGRLAHGHKAGLLGLWTFRPAYFADLRVSECRGLPEAPWQPPEAPAGSVDEWFAGEFGVMRCEPGGILNLNRYLPASVEEVTLTRQFETGPDEQLELRFGFSDQLCLELDGEVAYEGTNTFAGFADYEARGYAYPGMKSVGRRVSKGVHRLTSRLKVTEPFGWGLTLSIEGQEIRLLPANLG